MGAVIGPTQFSALKSLNPLDQQEQQGEDDDRQGQVQQVGHGHSSVGSSAPEPLHRSGHGYRTAPQPPESRSKRAPCDPPALPNRTHAPVRPTPCKNDLSVD